MGLCFSREPPRAPPSDGGQTSAISKIPGLSVKILDLMTTIEYVHVSFYVKAVAHKHKITQTFNSCIRIADIPSSWSRQDIIDAAWKKKEEDVHRWIKINERLQA